jgi:hypothetical protein
MQKRYLSAYMQNASRRTGMQADKETCRQRYENTTVNGQLGKRQGCVKAQMMFAKKVFNSCV